MRRYIEFMQKKGHDVVLFTYERKHNPNVYEFKMIQPRIPLLRIGVPIIKKLFMAVLLKYYIRKFKPDLIHAYDLKLHGIAAAFAFERPLIISLVGADILLHSKILMNKPFCKMALSYADFLHAYSKDIERNTLLLGVNPRKLFVNYIGIELEKYDLIKETKSKLRKELQLNPNSIIIISTRGFGDIYGQIYQVLALKKLVKSHPNVLLIFAGAGPTLESIKNSVKKLNLDEHVIFLGHINEDLLAKYYKISDIYVSTTYSDGCPASNLEAMYNELPVVAFNVGGVPEFLKDDKNGYLVPLKNLNNLVDKLNFLVENEDKRINFGRKGKRIIEKQGDFNKNMEKMESFYNRIMNHIKKKR